VVVIPGIAPTYLLNKDLGKRRGPVVVIVVGIAGRYRLADLCNYLYVAATGLI